MVACTSNILPPHPIHQTINRAARTAHRDTYTQYTWRHIVPSSVIRVNMSPPGIEYSPWSVCSVCSPEHPYLKGPSHNPNAHYLKSISEVSMVPEKPYKCIG